MGSRAPLTVMGSSPRVRGKQDRAGAHRGQLRLIPARAGKTVHRDGHQLDWLAHPRACGENAVAGSGWPMRLGSSPRVRGKLPFPFCQRTDPGLIPARAGKTGSRSSSRSSTGAHPRACGENAAFETFHPAVGGSSPRVRGKPRPTRRGHRRGRLIPARAGKTSPNPARTPPRQAHPRACGENMTVLESAPSALGSSPRVRGKPLGRLPPPVADRLIPARAGKTLQSGARISDQTAHPRACGENRLQAVSAEALDGSSPRVRGKPITEWESARIRGLIPARAGKTARS